MFSSPFQTLTLTSFIVFVYYCWKREEGTKISVLTSFPRVLKKLIVVTLLKVFVLRELQENKTFVQSTGDETDICVLVFRYLNTLSHIRITKRMKSHFHFYMDHVTFSGHAPKREIWFGKRLARKRGKAEYYCLHARLVFYIPLQNRFLWVNWMILSDYMRLN